jgi:hypothetical protein
MRNSCPVLKFKLKYVSRNIIGLKAFTGNGANIAGSMLLSFTPQKTLKVDWIHVDKNLRRCGVGTQLYAYAAKYGCRKDTPLQSDSLRSGFAESFWAKQRSKKRATCRGTHGLVNDGVPFPGKLPEHWPCKYYVTKCPVISFAGVNYHSGSFRR